MTGASRIQCQYFRLELVEIYIEKTYGREAKLQRFLTRVLTFPVIRSVCDLLKHPLSAGAGNLTGDFKVEKAFTFAHK